MDKVSDESDFWTTDTNIPNFQYVRIKICSIMSIENWRKLKSISEAAQDIIW